MYATPLDPWSTVMTLVFVLLVTSVKEGAEDLQRNKSDQYENNRDVIVVTFDSNGNIQEEVKKSKHVSPGDIIKMSGQGAVPVDLLLILTSQYFDGNKCYIETANIDGETNLKVREAPPGLYDIDNGSLVNNGKPIPDLFSGSIQFEEPNKNIHKFIGTLTLTKLGGEDNAIPLCADNVLLRSSLFTNTDWAYGIAIYTGQETKIQMNNRHAPSKMSKIEEYLNKAIIIIFFAQVLLVCVSVISIYIMGFQDYGDLPYVYPDGAASRTSVLPLWLEQWYVFCYS